MNWRCVVASPRRRSIKGWNRLAEFANYDEYGNAALAGATICCERSFNAEELRAFSRSTLAARK